MAEAKILEQRRMSAEEAASLIRNMEVLGTSGFTPAGYPKAIPRALARRARELHEAGDPFKISLYTGASTGDELDGELARADAIFRRLPYQGHPDVRSRINSGEIEFVDMHLSHVVQFVRYGVLAGVSTAIIEASEVTDDGKIFLTMSGGATATYVEMADRVFIELNRAYDDEGLKHLHDVYIPDMPPHRGALPLACVDGRIGTSYVQVHPSKIAGIVETDQLDVAPSPRDPDEVSRQIADNVMEFLIHEEKRGRLPKGLPLQVGVGNVANAVLGCMARHPHTEPLRMYTEVVQDSIFELLEAERLAFASTTALALSTEGQARFLRESRQHKGRFLIRQQEISNHPEIIRRLGVVSMNTAVEMDLFGNVNSTHVLGSKMLNGIGGSGDFCRNAFVSMFVAPSTTRQGAISTVVPMVSHVDHNEHSTQVLVTDQGIADLRGLPPVERARRVIQNCAHPEFRDELAEYLEYGLAHAPSQHTPHVLSRAFAMHTRLAETGSMRR